MAYIGDTLGMMARSERHGPTLTGLPASRIGSIVRCFALC
jgi:hypothetical protein